MASVVFHLFLVFSSTLLCLSTAQKTLKPKALILPVTKVSVNNDLQYTTILNQRTPLKPITVAIDLGGRFLWVDCDSSYVSRSYIPVRCGSSICTDAGAGGCGSCFSPPKPGCNNNTCSFNPYNPFIRTSTSGEAAQDVLSLSSTDGKTLGSAVTIPRFTFSCGASFLLKGLANGATGIVGLGRNRNTLPSQASAAFSFARKFAVCLPSSSLSRGFIILGDGPYFLNPNVEASSLLSYTPLFINPVSTAGSFLRGERSVEYFIGVTSINVNEKPVPVNSTLLKINRRGNGGTKLSTVDSYTKLQTSIYNSVTQAFVKEATALNITRVGSVSPFGTCFAARSIRFSRGGWAVPTIDFVLQSKNFLWRFNGRHSIVQVNNDVACLAFVDGGLEPTTSIVIGGYQLEDIFLQFDVAGSRLGFSPYLGLRQTACSNFNFGPAA